MTLLPVKVPFAHAYWIERESQPKAEADSNSFLAMRAFRHASGYNQVASMLKRHRRGWRDRARGTGHGP